MYFYEDRRTQLLLTSSWRTSRTLNSQTFRDTPAPRMNFSTWWRQSCSTHSTLRTSLGSYRSNSLAQIAISTLKVHCWPSVQSWHSVFFSSCTVHTTWEDVLSKCSSTQRWAASGFRFQNQVQPRRNKCKSGSLTHRMHKVQLSPWVVVTKFTALKRSIEL